MTGPAAGVTTSAPPASSTSASPSSRHAWSALSSRKCTSHRRRAAFGAERRARRHRGAAVAAEAAGLGRGGQQRGPAVLAELAAAGLLLARRAEPDGLVAVVDPARPVDPLDLLVQLVDLGLRLHAGNLLVEAGRAGRAQAALAVPADLLADPLSTAVALVEVDLHLAGGLGQRLVARRAAHAVAHPLGVPADLRGLLADVAAEEVATDAQQPAAEAGHRVPERRGTAGPAPHAVAPELIPLAGRHARVVVRAHHHARHVLFLP